MEEELRRLLDDFDFQLDVKEVTVTLLIRNAQMMARLNAIYDHFPRVAAAALTKEEEYIEEELEETRTLHEANILADFVSRYGKVREKGES